jgi:hypothetical protein
VIARKRGIPDVAIRRRCNAVGAGAFRCFPGLNFSAGRIDTAVDAALTRKPKNTFAVEGRGVEIGAGKFFRQPKKLPGFGRGYLSGRSRFVPHR